MKLSFVRLTLLVFMMLALLVMPSVALADGPTISTGLSDYEPGDTVTFTGSGFVAGEVVNLVAVGTTNGTQITAQATADANGSISGSFNLQFIYEYTYSLTATGGSGDQATTSFGDSNPPVNMNQPSSPVTLGPAGTQTYQAQVKTTGGGPIENAWVKWSATGGTMNQPCTQTAHNGQTSSTYTAGSTDGTFAVTATQMSGSNCSGTAVGSDSQAVMIDATPPTIAITPASGTYLATSLTFNWSITDPTSGGVSSGVKTTSCSITVDGTTSTGSAYCSGSQTLGAGTHTVSVSGSDNVGNSATANRSYTITADSTPPTANPTQSPAANGAGWNNTDVTVTWNWTDNAGGTGIDSANCTTSSTSSGEGTLTLTATCKDLAGNTGTASYTVKVDKTAPTISFVGPSTTPWYKADVTASWNCLDALSGAVSASVSATTSGEGSAQSVTGTCTDNAGNTASNTQSFKVDKTAPTISYAGQNPAANGNGWNKTDVTLTWNCGDALSGPVAPSVSQTLTSEGANQSATGTCTDNAGNTASNTQSGINIDKTAPTIAIASPGAGPYTLKAAVASNYTCTDQDGLSGVATCSGPVTSGANFDTSTVGPHTFTVNATDKAGNPSSKSVTYNVNYAFSGFLQPINDTGRPYACPSPCPISVFKAGSTIPAKFQLKDANGIVVQAGTLPLWLTPVQGSGTSAPIDESNYSDPASTGNTYRWDSTSQQYIYNWGTSKNGVGFYWRIFVKLDDGQTYFVDVGLR